MSQYALFLRKRGIKGSTRFIFDRNSLSQHNGYELGRVFNIGYTETLTNKALHLIFRILGIKKVPILSKPLIRLLNILGCRIIAEKPNYDYDESVLSPSRGLRFYYGGWHSERYFHSIRDEVLASFKLNVGDEDKMNLALLDEIRKTNSVSIHVRRGDYLSEKNFNTFGAVCSKAYFDAAIKEIGALVDNPHFFVFSNDVAWVEDNLHLESLTIVDCNKGKDSWKDLFLMSNCKHNINSNSTFSWWASWLNDKPGRVVIVPRFFINNVETKDLYPDNWLQLTNY